MIYILSTMTQFAISKHRKKHIHLEDMQIWQLMEMNTNQASAGGAKQEQRHCVLINKETKQRIKKWGT